MSTRTTTSTGSHHVTDSAHPDSAFHFRSAMPAEVASKAGNAPRKFKGTAYSGNAIRHGYWGQVVFDLSSTRSNAKTPALVNHDPDKRCGFAALTIGADSIQISEGSLLDNEHGKAVAAESDAGFPWQMSVFIQPGSIEELKAGTAAIVNGQQVQGPATVFRNNLIREVSFTPTGVDNDTEAAAFSAARQGAASSTKEEIDMTELEQLKAKVAELSAGLAASEAKATAAEARATQAETALTEHRRSVRASAVKELFSALKREHTEESAAPYMEMSDQAFSAVAADLKASIGTGDKSHLFSEHATGGAADQGGSEQGVKASLNLTEIYRNRRTA